MKKGLLIIVSLFFLASCQSFESVYSKAEKLLEEKYEDNCEIIPLGGSTGDYVNANFNCDGVSGDINVEYNAKDNTIKDNYLAYKYYEETKCYFLDVLSKYYLDGQVIYEVEAHLQASNLNKNSSFEEFIAYEIDSINNLTFIVPSLVYSHDVLEDLAHELSALNSNMYVSLYVLDYDGETTFDSDSLAQIVSDKLYDYEIAIYDNRLSVTKMVN